MNARALVRLTDAQWKRIRQAPIGVVVLCRTNCGKCDVYQADIERNMRTGVFDGLVFGRLVTDDLRGSCYVKANPWVLDIDRWPLTVIYRHGSEVDRFSGNRAARLIARIHAIQDRFDRLDVEAAGSKEQQR